MHTIQINKLTRITSTQNPVIYEVNQQSHSLCQGGNFAAVLGKGLWLPRVQPPAWLPPGVQPCQPHSTAGDVSPGERESAGLQQM